MQRKAKIDVKLYLDAKEITRVTVTKYLGVYLDEKLSWLPHVEHVISKIIQLKGAFYYLSNVLDKKCYRQIYYAYVFSYIKYGIEIYGLCSTTLLNRLQREQNKCLKILYHKDRRFNTNRLYNELQLLKCIDIHKLFVGIFMYKHQNNMLPEIFSNYYKLNCAVHSRITRQSNKLHIPYFRTTGGQKSIKHFGAKLWNDIDATIKASSRLSIFKHSYTNMLLGQY